MKFNHSCWAYRDNYSGFSPAQVYRFVQEENAVVLTMPTSKILHRGNTLGGVMLTVRISSPLDNILRVQVFHHTGSDDPLQGFAIQPSGQNSLSVKETAEYLYLESDKLCLQIEKDTGVMLFCHESKEICRCAQRDLTYLKDNQTNDTYLRCQLSLGIDEHIYGLGERFGPFVKNGQSIDIWNDDAGSSSDISYKNIPFYMSDKGYGVLVNYTGKVSYEVGSEMVEKIAFSVPGETLDFYFISGSNMKDVLSSYTGLTGRPALPPPWSFGLWLSTSFTTNYDEQTVQHFVEEMLRRDIPLSVFHFDCFWMQEFSWCDFTWDPKVFPDPKGMLERMHQKGLKICVWINSYIAQASPLFEEGKKNGYFLKRTDGSVWQCDNWQPGLAIVDFTNPDACSWYAGKLEQLIDMGVDCFKTDFGEQIPLDCIYYNGQAPEKMHNYYTYLYNQIVYQILVRKKGKKEALVFARSATAGSQKFPVHWGGDCWSNYDSMAESLRGGLSLTSSGFGFWSHDIGGFEDTSSPDVYKRWCAFGLLSTHSRLHGSGSYRVPWNYDEESVAVLSHFVKLKLSLMPYLYRNAIETSQTGIPMMRSMALEFTADPNCAYLSRQYMLGDSLLVAPVFQSDGMASYYLPAGIWTNFFTNEEYVGEKWYCEKHDYFSIPLFVRPNSIVAVGAKTDSPVYEYEDNVCFRVYRPQANQSVSTSIYSADGRCVATLQLQTGISETEILVETTKPCDVLLMNTEVTKVVSGEEYFQYSEQEFSNLRLHFSSKGKAKITW